jgi:hypothetical protein
MFFIDAEDDVTSNTYFAKKPTKTSTTASRRPFNGGTMKRNFVAGLARGVVGTFNFVVLTVTLVSLDARSFG